jgi:uncharacterized protein YggE
MNFTDSKKLRGGVTTLVWLGVIFLVAETISVLANINPPAQNISNIPTIVVSGQGQAVVIPNAAEFSFSVTKTAATVAAAQNAASTLTNQAIAALKSAGVADKDLQTTDYSINPHYTYSATPTVCPLNGCPPVQQVISGYDVSQTIDVTVETASSTSQLLSTIGQLGVTNISGVTFTESDKNAVQNEARANAIANAQTQAATLASQLGVTLGRIVSFQESSNNYPMPIYAAQGLSSASNAAVAPNIPTGQNKITDNVTITYAIK